MPSQLFFGQVVLTITVDFFETFLSFDFISEGFVGRLKGN